MKTNYLFPHRFKTLSGILFVLCFLLLIGFFAFNLSETIIIKAKVFALMDNMLFGKEVYFGWVENNIVDEILVSIIIASGIIYAFSKEEHEDELVASIRLQSLAWATIANYAILLFCYIFIYGLPFLNVLMGAMFSQLIIFILLFRYKIFRFYNTRHDEE
ncbi:hypothetical protein [Flavobacterium rhizosphaerae]|uniref:Uncharacterized protein n=1 Tax=Flavobacterium rhizosphaerae TaxID=3163298 RepID=A0ABW8YVZ6_9FLAO